MPDRSPSEIIKPEVRAASAYTLRYFNAPVKLDQNENPYEIPDGLKQKIVDRVLERHWGRYPEFVPADLIQRLAKFTGWTADGILAGNGSNELINACLMATLGPGRTVVIPQPTFTLYRLTGSALGASIVTVRLKADMSFDSDALVRAAETADVVILCAPNNPTGTPLAEVDLERVADAARGLVIVDEAYHEFSGQTAFSLLERYPNLVVLRTFSKAKSMAGLRFGYMMAAPEITAEVYKVKLPYNVNIFTLTAAEMVIEAAAIFEEPIRKLVEERKRVATALANRPYVEAFPSAANFILFRTPHPAVRLFEALFSEGVLVRDVSSYPMLDRCLRVSIGTPHENARFLDAMDRSLETLA